MKRLKIYLIFLIILLLTISAFSGVIGNEKENNSENNNVQTFSSSEEFTEYVNNHRPERRYYYLTSDIAVEKAVGGDGSVPRHSNTNIQVNTIEEPDILKTNGLTTFYSVHSNKFVRPIPSEENEKKVKIEDKTFVIDTSNPPEPEILSNVSSQGQMILHNNLLVIYNSTQISTYDVSNPSKPTKEWKKSINGSIVTTRLKDGVIYTITRKNILNGNYNTYYEDSSNDELGTIGCPFEPIEDAELKCTDIAKPNKTNPINLYSVVSLNIENGNTIDSVGVLRNTYKVDNYVSNESIYISGYKHNTYSEGFGKFILKQSVIEVNSTAKDTVNRILQNDSLSENEKIRRLRKVVEYLHLKTNYDKEEEFERELEKFVKNNKDLFTGKTQITKIKYNDGELYLDTRGSIGGRVIGQFAFHENENGNLHVAATMETSLSNLPSTNVVYTLDKNLKVVGRTSELAKGQQIFAVRYIDERAYLITFEQVDPFHVVNIEDKNNPYEMGKVKLPGVSRYLHPVGENEFIGVGTSGDGNVKITLFNAKDPNNPVVKDEIILEDSKWSAIGNNHRAFTYDKDKGIAFIPSDNGGTAIKYNNGGISKEYTISTEEPAKRIAYIGNSVYVFTENSILVADEKSGTLRHEITLFEGV